MLNIWTRKMMNNEGHLSKAQNDNWSMEGSDIMEDIKNGINVIRNNTGYIRPDPLLEQKFKEIQKRINRDK